MNAFKNGILYLLSLMILGCANNRSPMDLLQSKVEKTRLSAISNLRINPDYRAIPILLKIAMNDSSESVRGEAVITLSNYSSSTLSESLEKLDLVNATEQEKLDIIYMLRSTSDLAAKRIVCKMLQDRSSMVRRSCYVTISHWSSEVQWGGGVLLKQLDKEDGMQEREKIVSSLKALNYQPALPKLIQMRDELKQPGLLENSLNAAIESLRQRQNK